MRKRLLFFLTLAVIVLAAYAFLQRDPLNNRLTKWDVKLNLAGFKLTQLSSEQSKNSKTEDLEAQNNQIIAKITKTQINDHQKFIMDRKFLLESLFRPTTSPYPEVITNVVECPAEFKPKVEALNDKIIYTLFAGERFNFGVCSQDLVKYQAIYGIFDCGKKGIFEVRLFGTSSPNLDSIINKFTC